MLLTGVGNHLAGVPNIPEMLAPEQRLQDNYQGVLGNNVVDSGADNWEQRSYLPIYETANWYADGKRFELPDDFYSSRFLVDKMIEFIDPLQPGQRSFPRWRRLRSGRGWCELCPGPRYAPDRRG